MDDAQERLNQAQALLGQLSQRYPERMEAFSSFVRSTESGPALSSRQGAVINVALSVAAQCEWCIAWHVTDALKAGATEDELMEAGFLAVLMHGAPAMMYLTTLIDALEEFGNGGSGAHDSPAD